MIDPLKMIDPLLPPRSAERLAALRQPAQKRRKPAHSSKIMTAGISTTALLGLITAMGWPTGTGNAQSATQVAPVTDALTPVAQVIQVPPLVPVVPATTALVVPVVIDTTVAAAPAALPAVVPETVPATVAPVPVVVPVAVPVAQPVQKKKRTVAASNTATKTSG